MPTVNPPGENYDSLSHLLAERLQQLGLETQRYEVPGADVKAHLDEESQAFPRYNVLGKWQAGAAKTLHANAHYDVVPVSGKWKFDDPFSGKIEDGWMYGRGTADMKGAIACLLIALQALRYCGHTPRVNLEVSLVADEEIGGALGSGWIAKNGNLQADYVLILEGGGGEHIGCGHNGALWMDVTVHGKSAHGSAPQRGINALEKTAQLVLALGEYKEILAKRSFTVPNGTVMHPTINVGGVFDSGAGGKVNTVPGFAHFTIDRRLIVTESIEDVQQEMTQFIEAKAAEIGDCPVEITPFLHIHPCFSEPRDAFFQKMAQSVNEVRQGDADFKVSGGFNDGGLFFQQLHVPVMGYGPNGIDLHAINERVSLEGLINTAKVYAHLLATFEG